MKKLKVSLLAKVVIAIAAGVVFGQFLPGGIAPLFTPITAACTVLTSRRDRPHLCYI